VLGMALLPIWKACSTPAHGTTLNIDGEVKEI
jgi:hypothetical protein